MIIQAQRNATDAQLTQIQAQLNDAASDLLWLHQSILDGNATLGLAGTAYASEEHNEVLFGTGCLRKDKSACYRPSDPFYARTRYGLDAMVRYFVEARGAVTPAAHARRREPCKRQSVRVRCELCFIA